MSDDLGFVHRFEPGAAPDAPVLLLLHGTGGDENDLIPLGRLLLPGAALLAPRGKVLEHGMPRFFRRLAMGVFDEQDLVARTAELAGFVAAAAGRYGFDVGQVNAAGFSNGANIGAALLLLHPATLRRAVLLRAMTPLSAPPRPDLTGRSVFLAAGEQDSMVPAANTERLAAVLREAGADVTLHWSRGGHELAKGDVDAAAEWLAAEKKGVMRDG